MSNISAYQFDNKLQTIMDSFEDAILVESKDRLVECINDSFHQLFKLKNNADFLIGTNSEEIVVASSLQFKNPSKFIYRIEEIINERRPQANEEVLLLDGRILTRTFIPVFVNNELVRFVWIYKIKNQFLLKPIIDIQSGNNFFEKILNNISLPIAVLNVQHEFVFVNKNAIADDNKRKVAIGRTEIEYNSYFNKPNDLAFINADYLRSTISSKQTTTYEEKHYNEEGNILYNKVVLFPLLKENEEAVEYVIRYAIDITSIKQREIECEHTINQYIDILNTINESVFITNDSLELSYSNTSFINKLSLEAELIKKTIFSHVDVTQYDFYRNFFSVLAGKEEKVVGKIEVENNNSTKTFLYKLNKLTPFNKDKKAGIVAILNDITNEVVLEENLLEVVKREKELNELKSAFVNMVSHEMRTPLAIISSCAEIMQLMIANNKPKEEVLNYTNHILSEVDRMTTFMNDILMVSKIEAGKIEFNPEPVSLINFINELSNKSYAPWKDNRTLQIDIKGAERQFSIDTKMIRHILQNLLDNAFKYSAGKASPKLRISYSNTFVTISIVDNGIGIHPDDISKLFSSFSRGRNVGSINGTGIGLVVVKYFVNQHNGNITVRSKINGGSIFSLRIPYIR